MPDMNENAETQQEYFGKVKLETDYKDLSMRLYKRITDLEIENAELKKNFEDLKEFYEKEYFEIADKTANERIKELEQYETEITVDDYSPYDENTWGMMHEEMFVPKNLVIDMLKEIYAYIENLKKENAEQKERVKEQSEKISELTQELDDVINRFE